MSSSSTDALLDQVKNLTIDKSNYSVRVDYLQRLIHADHFTPWAVGTKPYPPFIQGNNKLLSRICEIRCEAMRSIIVAKKEEFEKQASKTSKQSSNNDPFQVDDVNRAQARREDQAEVQRALAEDTDEDDSYNERYSYPAKHKSKRKRNPSPLPAPSNYRIPKKSDMDGARQRGRSTNRPTHHPTGSSRDNNRQSHRSSSATRSTNQDFGQSRPPYKSTHHSNSRGRHPHTSWRKGGQDAHQRTSPLRSSSPHGSRQNKDALQHQVRDLQRRLDMLEEW